MQPRTFAAAIGRRATQLWERVGVPLLGLAVLALSLAFWMSEPETTEGIASTHFPIRERLRNITYDALQRISPRPYSPQPVRIVDIDEASLKRIGQWPWPRTRLAALVERLRAEGAAAIAFDVVFAEADRTSPEVLAQALPRGSELADLLQDMPRHDATFADAVKAGSVITGFVLSESAADSARPALKPRLVERGPDPRPMLAGFSGAIVTLPAIEATAAGNGALNFEPGLDGVVRRVPLILRLENRIYPTLASEALRVATGGTNLVVKSADPNVERGAGHRGVETVTIGRVPVPTDPRGGVWLHFTRPVPERYIPAWEVLESAAPREDLKGSIVFVGTSAKGLLDLRFSPLGLIIPGVEIHAQLIEQILEGSLLNRPAWADAAEMLSLALVAVLVIGLIAFLGPGWSAGIVAVAVLGALSGCWYAFSAHRLLFDPLYPSATVAAIFLACSLLKHVQSERKGRWIRQAFSSYLSRNLVEHLIENPDQLRLGGEHRECSFVLTDLAGFTTVVERSDAAALVALMNEYIDGMVSIAFKHDGTLDRIVGDAIAVMFSAPLTQADHARRAVACALDMDAFAQRFKAAKNAAGIPIGNTRIGVNSGKVIVGNFGGQQSFDYRALGDPINTAARLESLNRHLNTRVCVSGATVAQCPGFTGRPIGVLMLKGKTEPVTAFEALPGLEATSPRVAAYAEAYRTLESGDPEALRVFTELAQRYPDDVLAAFHLARLERGETGATIVMLEK